MLKQLRSRKFMKRAMQVTLILVIPSFVAFYGWTAGQGGGPGGGGGDWFARLKSEGLFGWDEIQSRGEMQAARDELRDWVTQALFVEGELTEDREANQRKAQKLSESTRLIALEAVNLRLLERAAEDSQVSVPEEELRQAVIAQIRAVAQANPEVARRLTPGQIWQRFLQSQRMTEDQYRARDRAMRTRQKVMNQRMDEALPSLYDLWDMYRSAAERIEAEWAKVRVLDFVGDTTVSTDSVRQFFREHAEDYAFPERREYEFVVLRRYQLLDDVEVTSSAARSFYDENHARFTEPPAVKPRLIFLARPEPDNATTGTIDDYVAKVEKVRDAVLAEGADFAALANEHTDDPSNLVEGQPDLKKGGLLDEFISARNPSRYGRTFDNAVLALDEGETTGPIGTYFGAFFMQAAERIPARLLTYEEARDDAFQAVREQMLTERFVELGERFRKENERRTTLESLAEAMGVEKGGPTVVEADSFAIPGLGNLQEQAQSLRYLSPEDPKTGVISTPYYHAVVQLTRELPARAAEFEEVEGEVRRDLRYLKAAERARERAEALLARLEAPDADLETLANEMGVGDTYTSGGFTRERPLLGTIPRFPQRTRDLTTGTVRLDVSVNPMMEVGGEPQPMDFVVWRVLGLDSPDRREFVENVPRILNRVTMVEAYKARVYREWLNDERRAARFELNEDLAR